MSDLQHNVLHLRMVSITRLVWDAWNIAHIARHEVTPDEVEEVCHDDPLASATDSGRIRLIGPNLDGKILTVILDPEEEGVYYVVTARSASRKERRRFQERKGVDSK